MKTTTEYRLFERLVWSVTRSQEREAAIPPKPRVFTMCVDCDMSAVYEAIRKCRVAFDTLPKTPAETPHSDGTAPEGGSTPSGAPNDDVPRGTAPPASDPSTSGVGSEAPLPPPSRICPECGIVYAKRRDLVWHMHRDHPGVMPPPAMPTGRPKRVQPTTCPKCGKDFETSAKLRGHLSWCGKAREKPPGKKVDQTDFEKVTAARLATIGRAPHPVSVHVTGTPVEANDDEKLCGDCEQAERYGNGYRCRIDKGEADNLTPCRHPRRFKAAE